MDSVLYGPIALALYYMMVFNFLEYEPTDILFQALEHGGAVDKRQQFRHVLLYGFQKGSKAGEDTKNICAVYGEDSIAGGTAQKWYVQFKDGNFKLLWAPSAIHKGARAGIAAFHPLARPCSNA